MERLVGDDTSNKRSTHDDQRIAAQCSRCTRDAAVLRFAAPAQSDRDRGDVVADAAFGRSPRERRAGCRGVVGEGQTDGDVQFAALPRS